jgi:tripartite-type tricarboxylate transporter receptor subunit TctC
LLREKAYRRKRMKNPKKIKTTLFWKILPCPLILGLIVCALAFAAEEPAKFPSRAISLIVNFNPGSSTDLTSRKLADLAGKILGKPIVCENRPGGAGVIGANDVAKATPNGYTIGGGTSSAIIFAPFVKKVPYNPKDDFSWIILHTEQSQGFCVLSNARWKTFKEFVEDARKNPGKFKVGITGVGGASHILLEQVFASERVKIDFVPTSGGGELVAFVLGGHVDAGIGLALNVHIKSKKLRALGLNSDKRMEICPDVPTFKELGYKIEVPVQWLGIYGPKNIPPAILEKLSSAFKKASEGPSFKELLKTLILTPMYEGPKSAQQLINRDFDTMARLSKTFKKK